AAALPRANRPPVQPDCHRTMWPRQPQPLLHGPRFSATGKISRGQRLALHQSRAKSFWNIGLEPPLQLGVPQSLKSALVFGTGTGPGNIAPFAGSSRYGRLQLL